MQMIQTAANPQAAMNMMMMNNPQMKEVMEVVRQYGGDSMAAFNAMAEKCGVDPEEIMGLLR